MRYPVSEKLEIIRIVEQSHLSVRRTLDQIGVSRATIYRWYNAWLTDGTEGSERQSGQTRDLALHLVKEENEHVEVHKIRGFASDNLLEALNEAYAFSRATKAKQFPYSLSVKPRPDKAIKISDFEAAIDRAEQKLGLEGQGARFLVRLSGI